MVVSAGPAGMAMPNKQIQSGALAQTASEMRVKTAQASARSSSPRLNEAGLT